MFTRRPIAYTPGDSERWQRMYEGCHNTAASQRKADTAERKEHNNG